MIPGPEWFVAACALFTAGLLWAEKRESVRLKWLFKPLASASFERGRLAYCRSDVPGIVGIHGGSHDPPTGILELYEQSAS
jgi:hypothetical protein